MTTLLVIAVLIALNAIFVAAEFAIVGAPRAAIDARAARKQPLARLVQSVLHDPARQDRYIATAQIGITVASLGLGMYGEHVLAYWVLSLLGHATWSEWLAAHGFSSVVAVAILTYFHIVLGEMVPKSLALRDAEQIALWITPPMLWIQTLLLPLVVALNTIGNGVLKFAGIRRRVETADQYSHPRSCNSSFRNPRNRERFGPTPVRCCASCSRSAIGPSARSWFPESGSPASRWDRPRSSFAPSSDRHRIHATRCSKATSTTSSACITSRICCGCC